MSNGSERFIELIRERPLGSLVVLSAAGLNANHIPFELDAAPAPLGNPARPRRQGKSRMARFFVWTVEALVIFQGPQT